MEGCRLCPRNCGADREIKAGACTATEKLKLARAALHFWEEPPISGTRGSGTVFFCGCPLGCVFCQNREISRGGVGNEITISRLAEIFAELEKQGAHNINLVTPTHYTPQILEALDIYRPNIPIAVNTGGYEKVETIKQWQGYADIWMPDLKCVDAQIGKKYFSAPDYFDTAIKAIAEMHALQPKLEYNPDGTLQKGLVVRHLVLPGHREDSKKVIDALNELLPRGSWLFSLMSQFTPTENCKKYPEINRRVTTFEYNSVVKYALSLGLDGFMQERSSAKEEYTPPFDLTGV